MKTIWYDLKFTLRGLTRNFGFAAVAATVMALGIGATTYAFLAINAIALQPLPYPDADELVHLEFTSAEQPGGYEIGLHDFQDLAAEQTSFEQLFAYYSGTVNVSGDGQPVRYNGIFVSANALDQLGVPPAHGGTFAVGDDAPGAPLSVMLGWELWQNRYGGDPSVVGRELRVNGRPATIAGVMPDGFEWPIRSEVWVPMQFDPANQTRAEALTVEVFGRLRDGVTIERARAEMSTLYARIQDANPGWNVGGRMKLAPYRDEFIGQNTLTVILTMQIATVLILMIACANVANLILARTVGRRRELSVRSALGASRWRLIAGTLGESVLIALVGGAVGVALAQVAGGATARFLIESGDGFPYWMTFGVDWRVAVFAFAVALLAGVVAGLLPALRSARADVTEGLKAGGGGGTSASLGKLTRTLVAVEIALSCALLIGGALSVRSVVNLQNADIGADVTGVMSGRIGLFDEYADPVARRQFWQELEARVAELPGVTGAAVTTSLPTYGSGWVRNLPAGAEPGPDDQRPWARHVIVTPTFFDVFRVPLFAGRGFDASDRADSAPVVVVNRKFAERTWPDADAVGRQLALGESGETVATVVGVVGDVYHHGLQNGSAEPVVYQPLAQTDARFASIAARTDGDVAALANPVRDALAATDPDLPVYWLQPAQVWVDQSRADANLLGVIFGVFGLAAVVLATVGVYGVLAFTVAQRTREFGVRRALGAGEQRIVHLVLGQGMRQLAIALPIGLVLAAGLGQLLSAVLTDVSALDPVSFIGIPLLLVAVVMAASWLPAARAARVNPMVALRYE